MAKRKCPTSPIRSLLTEKLVGGRFSDLGNYSELFDRTSDGILLIDPSTQEVLQANTAVLSFIGKPAAAIEGDSLENLFPQAFQALITSQGLSCEIQMGGMTLEVSHSPLRLADYCTVDQLIVRDVTAEKEKQRQLESLSLTDEMTGVANFRAFKSRLALEHERSQKKKTRYSVLFFDVDHFKSYNDRNGHPAGDEALRILARTLRARCDRAHFLARYGGEEFVILFSGADSDQAREFAEGCRESVESADFPHGGAQPLGKITTSIGICTYEGFATSQEILRAADEALYRAKSSGRNRVELAAPLSKKAA